MTAIEIARKMAALGQTQDAIRAYGLAIQNGVEPMEELEAAAYILQNGGDYRVSYTCFRDLYNRGFYREDILPLMEKVFYEPNIKLLKNRYERNCKQLKKYPYLFRKDFVPFEELPIRFFPYDDHSGYVPFSLADAMFGDFVNVKDTVISRNFFKDLENPILADDVYSQYELEYLHDNVRRSEDVGRENHIYLHYTDWGMFCAWLQVLNMRPLLDSQKIVFLIGDEIGQYPIDFKERFGIDYSQYPVKPVGIREIHRLIWHTQLATHNGGDFFNEIFDGHPNLIAVPSVMMDKVLNAVATIREGVWKRQVITGIPLGDKNEEKRDRLLDQLYQLQAPTDKDIFVALFMCMADLQNLDAASRITPAVFFQPHFPNILYQLTANDKGWAILESDEYEAIRDCPVFQTFKYIKTFTPMRRPTTSTAASVRFMYEYVLQTRAEGKACIMSDLLAQRVLNRSFMINWQDRLFKDSVLVRFEDGKLNPRATFTALASFLDLPYTESMTYCSRNGQRDPESYAGNDLGFSPAAIYRTYDEYMGEPERYFLEYFMRDAYEFYGYDFQYYDGAPMDLDRAKELIEHMNVFNSYIEESFQARLDIEGFVTINGQRLESAMLESNGRELLEQYIKSVGERRFHIAEVLLRGLRFVNKNGQPLRMMPKLQLDPALLEQPLYH